MRIQYLNGWVDAFVSLCAPEQCLHCGEALFQSEDLLCLQCLVDLPQEDEISARGNALTQLLRPRFTLHSALALFRFENGSPVQSLLHAIKYEDHEAAALHFGEKLGAAIRAKEKELPDVLIPVPLHPKKLLRRGYNQSERIARGISQLTGIRLDNHWLERTSFQESQTKLGRMQRWRNIRNSFHCTDLVDSAAHVGLVDDMITTGATLEACAQALNVRRLSVYSLAFEP